MVVEDSRNAAVHVMVGGTEIVCGYFDSHTGRLIHRLLESDLHVPLLLIDMRYLSVNRIQT
ncbi:hypothetical protein GCM10011585_29250 [Edaphobacter dinghuensis]|uniref:Uncharacterized protein n=1 Tax=Edaphobacter dinghuensis TaxID=1560005 RepID=A0A917HM78_9BACT|nr:hypothetical protein GCM10011585_29250 [Edaphobacter dinghuensis]